jgi:hypothetical protein
MERTTAIYLYFVILGTLRKRAYISLSIKTIVIHPEDPSTDVLSHIYTGLRDKTVINVGITKIE